MNGRVLVVDDEPAVRFTLRAILEDDGIEVVEASDGVAALERVRDGGRFDLLISDLQMPRMNGMELLHALREVPAAPGLVLVTAHGSARTAVEAMKAGAVDYFGKPFDADEIAAVVRRCLAKANLEAENARLRARLTLGRTMIFASEAMVRLGELVDRVARRDVTVLLTGESGTGKERVAQAIVSASKRSKQPYIRFNCAALPRDLAEAELFGHRRGAFTGASESRKGLFREADGGTLLLDEVNSLDPLTQGKLLRVLQEREVRPVGEDKPVPIDVRLIAAASADLRRVEDFRQDLFYRLNVVALQLPPLRDRRDDIAPLAHHFAARIGERFGLGKVTLTDAFLQHLRDAPWPGNVRELEHTIERSLALCIEPVLDGDPFEGESVSQLTLKQRVAAFERGLIGDALRLCEGNQSAAARQLGVSRVTLIDKIKKYGLRQGPA